MNRMFFVVGNLYLIGRKKVDEIFRIPNRGDV